MNATQYAIENKGGTFRASDLAPITPVSGYAVGVNEGTWRTVRLYAGADSHPADLARALHDCAEHVRTLVPPVGVLYAVGAWLHDGLADIDPVAIVASRWMAIRVGLVMKQKEIYDFATGEVIDLSTAKDWA